MNDIRTLLGGESDAVRALRLAIRAGWWTVLVGALVLAYAYVAGLFVLMVHPGLATTISGGVGLEEFRSAWFYFLAAFKFLLLVVVLLLIWAHLWTRSLMRAGKD